MPFKVTCICGGMGSNHNISLGSSRTQRVKSVQHSGGLSSHCFKEVCCNLKLARYLFISFAQWQLTTSSQHPLTLQNSASCQRDRWQLWTFARGPRVDVEARKPCNASELRIDTVKLMITFTILLVSMTIPLLLLHDRIHCSTN